MSTFNTDKEYHMSEILGLAIANERKRREQDIPIDDVRQREYFRFVHNGELLPDLWLAVGDPAIVNITKGYLSVKESFQLGEMARLVDVLITERT